jgi:NhaC family Na+:H+ antiporter
VPWGAAGGVCSQLLGVPTLQYLPYMWLAFLVPVFSLLYGFTGFAVWSVVGDPGDPPPEPTRLDRS